MKLTFRPKNDNVSYMYRGNSTRIVPVILVLIVIAIVIAAVVSIGRSLLGGNTSTSQSNPGRDSLLTTTPDHSVRFTVRGPLVANENFHSYQIVINSSSRSMTTYQGYLDQPINSRGYDNNVQAYEQFVYALDKANFMNADELTGDQNDTRGICATGLVYEFETLSNGSTVKKLWTSTCKGSPGSFKASVSQVSNLFLTQIPDQKALLSKLDLGTTTTLSF